MKMNLSSIGNYFGKLFIYFLIYQQKQKKNKKSNW